MSRLDCHILLLLVLLIALAVLPRGAHAFGAGSIPGYAYLHDRAFRHGDIENILSTLVSSPHHHAERNGGLLDFFSTLANKGFGAILQGNAAPTFSKSDVRRIYFGNWLRDYSQAMDIGGLSRMTKDTLLIIVQALGFMSFGFATREFYITPERLGVYLPVEHIDNPKGYAAKEGDARKFHPQLRAPVDPRELEIDESNGMKKYMATEGHSWDTSTAHIRRTFRECIMLGRRVHAGRPKADRNSESGDLDDCEEIWEAFRLLGTALHTLEDLMAHSNWCELALRMLGCSDVFCHVGDEVFIKTPIGKAPPMTTGTFGSADFMHSVLGEASDHLSQVSIVDLTVHMEESDATSSFTSLRALLTRLPDTLNPAQKVEDTAGLEERASHLNPKETLMSLPVDFARYAPSADLHDFLWDVLAWHDGIVRGIASGIESIPGLADLLDQLMDVLNQCVYILLAPVLIPIAKEVTLALKEQSQAVIDTEEQYEVFDNPKASDPTHSILAKDHVDLILNEPAGRVAQIVVVHTVNLIVHAWYESEDDIDQTIDKILEAFFHPYFATRSSKVQNDMLDAMQQWLNEFKEDEREAVLSSLTKQSVRDGRNKRITSLACSSIDTLSSLTGSDEDYGSVGGSWRSSSLEREEVRLEAPLERDRERYEVEHQNRVRAGYKSVLKNPRASEEARRHAREMLSRDTGIDGSSVRSTSRAHIDSNASFGSDEVLEGNRASGYLSHESDELERRDRSDDDGEYLAPLSDESEDYEDALDEPVNHHQP